MSSVLSILDIRPLIFDGAMGTMIQAAVSAECNALLSVERPEVISSIHEAYLEAGADVISTNTFGASSIDLEDYGLENRVEEINRASVELARRAVEKFATTKRPRFVCGEVGPTSKLPTLGHITYRELFKSYSRQIGALIDAGVDCLVVPTCQDILQMKAAAAAARETMSKMGREVPLFVSVTIEKSGRMLLGSDVMCALAAIEPFSPAAFGINCATGPEMMEEHLSALHAGSTFPILCRPNAGMPENVRGKSVYNLSPADFAREMVSFVEKLGVTVVGGCCGTTPEHIKALASSLEVGIQKSEVRRKVPGFKSQISSLFSAVSLDQEPRPFFAAEQTNVHGSKKFKELLLKNDYDGMAFAAKEAAKGAHALDLCVAHPGRDEVSDMAEVVSRIARTVDSPVMIDSTNTKAIEAALEAAPGRCIINSINLEDGGGKAKEILGLARRFGAAVVCLTIDENGMARTAEAKVEVARRLHELARSCGLRTADLIFDTLTFTVASGDKSLSNAAIETVEGMRRIKKSIKGARTILGVSNISYGLTSAARRVVTSLFLHSAVDAGLDCAILNPSNILRLAQVSKEEELLARRLLENDDSKGAPLQALLKYYEGSGGAGPAGKRKAATLHEKILEGDKSGLKELLEEACRTKKAVDVINGVLLPAMKEVGDLFGKGKLPLPFVLQSAEVMRAAIDLTSPRLEKGDVRTRGTIVLATVRGDVHDIGKNLVDIILSNNGFEVVNLGIRQPIGSVLEAAKEHDAQAIGLSGLLVSSTEVMREDLEVLKDQGMKIPVLVGGAALTKSFVQNTLQKTYNSPVYYCSDAFAGLKAMEEISEK